MQNYFYAQAGPSPDEYAKLIVFSSCGDMLIAIRIRASQDSFFLIHHSGGRCCVPMDHEMRQMAADRGCTPVPGSWRAWQTLVSTGSIGGTPWCLALAKSWTDDPTPNDVYALLKTIVPGLPPYITAFDPEGRAVQVPMPAADSE